MATKKKAAAKKPVRSGSGATKPAKKSATVKSAAKKPAKPAPNKTAPKKAAKPAAKKAVKAAVAKKTAPKKPEPKPAPKKAVISKPAPKSQPVKPAPKKPAGTDPKSLVSIKPPVKPIVKKEPPKPVKVVIPKTTTSKAVKYEPEFTKSVLDTPVNEQNGPTMRYSDAELAEFKELIMKKLDAAKKELAYLQGLITRKDEGGDMDEGRYMTMEDGSVSMEREQLSQMASRQITFIDHLEKALMRIENKTYGICRVTGKLIDKARLRAVPHATLSIEAKQMMNK